MAQFGFHRALLVEKHIGVIIDVQPLTFHLCIGESEPHVNTTSSITGPAIMPLFYTAFPSGYIFMEGLDWATGPKNINIVHNKRKEGFMYSTLEKGRLYV